MQTKVTYILVALAAVAAANPLPKRDSTSMAALEDNATCEPLVLTDEPQCAMAMAIGADTDDIEESNSLEKRADMRNGPRRFSKHLNKIAESCTRAFRNACILPSERRILDDQRIIVLVNQRGPVPGTNITIDGNPPKFVISYANDTAQRKQWTDYALQSVALPQWRPSGYYGVELLNSHSKIVVSCSVVITDCNFHLSAGILVSSGLSIQLKEGLWHFYTPTPEAPAPEAEEDDDDSFISMPSPEPR